MVADTVRAMTKPLLLLDVDGVLSPLTDAPLAAYTYETHYVPERGPEGAQTGPVWRMQFTRSHGTELRDLSRLFDIVWATAWGHDADRVFAPILGLPQLPVVTWPGNGHDLAATRRPRGAGSWKTPHLLAWLDTQHPGRPWVWVDDGIRPADTEKVAHHYATSADSPPASWLCHIQPDMGLLPDDFIRLRDWATNRAVAA